VAALLRDLGAGVIDSDEQAHEVLNTREVRRTLVEWWGERVCPDGQNVDRREIARIVFDAPAELGRLEGLLYPKIAERRDLLIERMENDPAIQAIALDSPKLLEAGLHPMCDALIVVDAPADVRRARLARSRGWSAEEVERREKRQMPINEKRAKADYVLINNSDLESLKPAIQDVFRSLTEKFRATSPS